MARRKKPEDETEIEAKHRRVLEFISNFSTRSEKTAWNRKLDAMVKLLATLQPIEDKIFVIMKDEKQPILDQIQELRSSMINDCVHPYEHLAFNETDVECKFCSRKFCTVTLQKENDERTCT